VPDSPTPRYQASFNQEGHYVHYRSHVSARDGAEMALRLKAAIELGRSHGCMRILFDSRGARFTPGVGTQYAYAHRQAWQLGLTRDWRIAMLASAGDDSYGFMETAFVNSGYSARLFHDLAPALTWLTQVAP
jgi:hypothetical protein